MDSFFFLVDFICLVLLISNIWESRQRLKSFFYALGAFLLVFILGQIAIAVLMPAQGSVIDQNEVLNKVGSAITIASSVAAVWAAHIPPRRVKKA